MKEVHLDDMIRELMEVALKGAGADRGLLVMDRDGKYLVVGSAGSAGDGVAVERRCDPITSPRYPASLLHEVLRTKRSVRIDDAASAHVFADDDYWRSKHGESAICLPVVRRGHLHGLFYLEGTRASRPFTPDRMATLEVIALQAAITIEVHLRYVRLIEENAELRRANEATRRSETRLMEIIETIPTIAFTATPSGLVDFANKRWREYTGAMPTEASLTGPTHLVHSGDYESRIAKWRTAFRTEEPIEYEARLRREDGEYRLFLFRAAPLRNAEGELIRWVAVGLDLEDRRRAIEALERIRATIVHAARVSMLGELTASLAHELNQPLAAISASGEATLRWLDREQPDLAEAKELARLILVDTRRASELIARVRAMIVGKTPMHVSVRLGEVIEEATLFMRHEIDVQKVRVTRINGDVIPEVRGDRTQLQQVIVNLSLNSIQAMADAGTTDPTITIELSSPTPHQVTCTFSDNGPGFASEHVDEPFQSFFTTKPTGMGMGLSICRTIMESHGGAISMIPSSSGACLALTLAVFKPGAS